MDKISDRQVFVNEFAKESARFENRGFCQKVVEVVVGIKGGIWRVRIDFAKIEPVVEEGVDEAIRLGVVEETFCLASRIRGFTQRRVWHTVPKKRGEAFCEGGGRKFSRRGLQIEEIGRAEHGRVGGDHGVGEIMIKLASLIVDLQVRGDLVLSIARAPKHAIEKAN
mgnify:CR=1 FL=1